MFIAILRHTHVRVWGQLVVLLALGVSQARERETSLARVTALALVMMALMTALSLSGGSSAFGHFPVAFGGWATGVGWRSLALSTAVFVLKYGIGASLEQHPELAADTEFAGLLGLAHGVCGGLSLARAGSLRRLAARAVGRVAA